MSCMGYIFSVRMAKLQQSVSGLRTYVKNSQLYSQRWKKLTVISGATSAVFPALCAVPSISASSVEQLFKKNNYESCKRWKNVLTSVNVEVNLSHSHHLINSVFYVKLFSWKSFLAYMLMHTKQVSQTGSGNITNMQKQVKTKKQTKLMQARVDDRCRMREAERADGLSIIASGLREVNQLMTLPCQPMGCLWYQNSFWDGELRQRSEIRTWWLV